ncbi:MAG TPA: ABC transporter permease [Vicinamibacterales bacterium]|nr:ABC transporter permease [Vicinamibacterales bacterium]
MRAPDLTLALRHLIRRPGFAITAVLLLALGAGANAAVFSVVRGVLLRPLPYHQPERLAAVSNAWFPNHEDLAYWRARSRGLQDIATLSRGWLMALVVQGQEPLKVTAGRISDNLFTTLGVSAAIGRTILPGDGTPGRPPVIVLSAGVHERFFSGDPDVLGRQVLLDDVAHEVVGVMPRGFEFLDPRTDVWAPVPSDPTSRIQFSDAIGRLPPGVTLDQANAELQSLIESMRTELSKTADFGREAHLVPLREFITGDVHLTLLILLAAVGLILLLAAVNLGTLVLGRSIERAREMAVRSALGASRSRLVRQLITEQTVLATLGAVAGLGLAWVALPALVRRIPPEIPRQGDIVLDGTVFAVVFGAAVFVCMLMALAPVVIAARPELQPLLRQNQSTETPARRRVLGTLVAAQIALAVVLGIGAGLMLRTLWNLQQVDPGFRADGVLTFRLQTTSKPMNLTRGLAYFEQVLERVRALPGVTHAGAIQHLPMSGYNWTSYVWRQEHPPAPGTERPTAIWRFVGWDYFNTMRIPLRAGRDFTAQDNTKAPAVAVINEAFAIQEFGSTAVALGRRLTSISARGEETLEVVGVVGDVRFESLDQPATPEMYRPLAQTFMFPMAFVVRTAGEPSQIAAGVRQAAFAVDPTIPVAELQPLTSLIAGSLGRPRLLALLLSVFAAVGLLLGVIGVYGVVAYRVRQQEREFGIRLALGAGPDRIAQGVLSQGAVYAGAGLLIGMPSAVALTRLMESVVFGVTTHDPLTFTALPLTVTLTTLLACAIPAKRAARVNPVTAMRTE